VNKTLHV